MQLLINCLDWLHEQKHTQAAHDMIVTTIWLYEREKVNDR